MRETMTPDRGLDRDPERSGQAGALHQDPRQGRVRPRQLGRGHRDHRRGKCLHRPRLRTRPGLRLLADPGDVDGQLCRRLALPVAAGRHLHVVLRLVLRPAAGLARRPGASRPTCRNSADWYNSGFLMLWGSNVPQTRTPDAHFYTEARYRGTKSAVICPDYSEAAKFGDIWLNPQAGHRCRAGHGVGPRHPARISPRPAGASISRTTAANTPICRCWCGWTKRTATYVPGRMLRAADFTAMPGRDQQPRLEDGRHRQQDWRSRRPRMARSDSAGAKRASGTSRRTRRGKAVELELTLDPGRGP